MQEAECGVTEIAGFCRAGHTCKSNCWLHVYCYNNEVLEAWMDGSHMEDAGWIPAMPY
jgi:hypothetical protein